MRALARSRKARRREHARNRQAPARFRHPSADDLFPAGSSGRADDRTDRNREQGNPRQLRRRNGTDLRRSVERSRKSKKRPANPTSLPCRRSPGSPPPNSPLGEKGLAAPNLSLPEERPAPTEGGAGRGAARDKA